MKRCSTSPIRVCQLYTMRMNTRIWIWLIKNTLARFNMYNMYDTRREFASLRSRGESRIAHALREEGSGSRCAHSELYLIKFLLEDDVAGLSSLVGVLHYADECWDMNLVIKNIPARFNVRKSGRSLDLSPPYLRSAMSSEIERLSTSSSPFELTISSDRDPRILSKAEKQADSIRLVSIIVRTNHRLCCI